MRKTIMAGILIFGCVLAAGEARAFDLSFSSPWGASDLSLTIDPLSGSASGNWPMGANTFSWGVAVDTADQDASATAAWGADSWSASVSWADLWLSLFPWF